MFTITETESNLLALHHTVLHSNTSGKESFENNVEKGEIAGKQQFFLIPTMFSTLPNTGFHF